MSKYREDLELWLKKIDVKASKVLDVGGGNNPINARVKSWDVDEYVIWDRGTEVQKKDLKKICKYYPCVDVCRKIFKELDRSQVYFDAVFMLEVGEYLYDPQEALINIWQSMKSGGVFYSSWPTLYPTHQPAKYDYIRYTQNYLKLLFKRGRLRIKDIIPRRTTLEGEHALSAFWRADSMHPLKHTDEVFHTGYLIKAIKP